jgi:hypothetical protein
VTGNGEAMGLPHPAGIAPGYVIAELLLGGAVVTAAALSSAAGPRRAAATVATGLIVFSVFKEAAVRSDFGHTAIFFGTAAGLIAAIAFGARRVLALAALAAILLVNVKIDANAGLAINYDPTTYVDQTVHQVRLLFDIDRNREALFSAGLRQTYHVPATLLSLLTGRTVHIDPSEVAVAWAYRLDWHPLPVFQGYTAYTSALDRADAAALASRDGPERILREDPTKTAVDNRFPTWDPPEKSLAMLCNYVPLETTPHWQVLGKVSDRCGTPRLIASENTRYGAVVTLPRASPGTVVYAKIHGAGVDGLEQVRSFLYRAKFRYIRVNGAHLYRLVPGTAGDGLLADAAPGVDYPRGFALSPSARTLELLGTSGPLRIDVYSRPVRPQP